ncbi:hypothetical protein ACH47Z_18125 [Streptomyces sp. NPDC020192]|uniref:hypothetical protein n=1 Tax=Streptomyces sp. NPDC020192 TaxID=3365066 RepID=UPI0037BC5EFE
MTRHTLTLLAFGDDIALIAVAAWPLIAELRWRRRERRASASDTHTPRTTQCPVTTPPR